MIEIIKEINVEVTKPNVFQAIVAKQYDMNTRFLKVTLMDCGTRINVPTIETAKVIINAERKDGQAKGFDGVINEDGTVTVPLHSWMLELDGTVICDISVIDTATDDNKKLTTTSFTLIVEKAAFGGDDVTSDPQYDILVSLLEDCQKAGEVAQEALEKSNEANSKYDACVEATENANQAAADASAVRSEIEEGGFIESLKEQKNGDKFTVWIGTTEEYEALTETEKNCFYILTDETTGDDMQAEIEDIKENIDGISDYIIEQGNKDGWRYAKYKSGREEVWYTTGVINAPANTTTPVILDIPDGIFAKTPNFIIPVFRTNSPSANMGLCEVTVDVDQSAKQVAVQVHNANANPFETLINIYAVHW